MESINITYLKHNEYGQWKNCFVTTSGVIPRIGEKVVIGGIKLMVDDVIHYPEDNEVKVYLWGF